MACDTPKSAASYATGFDTPQGCSAAAQPICVGDEFDVRVKVRQESETAKGSWLVEDDKQTPIAWFNAARLRAARRVPRPLAVGDTVKACDQSWDISYKILAIDGLMAWVSRDGRNHTSIPLATLERCS